MNYARLGAPSSQCFLFLLYEIFRSAVFFYFLQESVFPFVIGKAEGYVRFVYLGFSESSCELGLTSDILCSLYPWVKQYRRAQGQF